MTRECCECVSAAGCGPRAPKRSQSLIVDTFLRMFLVGRASPSSCAWSCGMCTCTCANQTHAHACATVRRHPHIVNAPATSKKRVFDFSHTSMPWKPIFGRKLFCRCCRNKAMSPAAPLGTTVSLSFYNCALISLIENRQLCISVFKFVLCSLNLYSFSKTRLP